MSSSDTPRYFNASGSGSRSSAEVVVSMLMDWLKPASVIDLGCGTGKWLATFRFPAPRDDSARQLKYWTLLRKRTASPTYRARQRELSSRLRSQDFRWESWGTRIRT